MLAGVYSDRDLNFKHPVLQTVAGVAIFSTTIDQLPQRRHAEYETQPTTVKHDVEANSQDSPSEDEEVDSSNPLIHQ